MKLLDKILKRWGYIPAKSVTKDHTMRVYAIDNTNNMAESLGLDTKWAKESVTIIAHAYYSNDSHSRSLEEISKHCKNPNELAFLCYQYGRNIKEMS